MENLDRPLGSWTTAQRGLFLNGELPTERKIRLEKIGFEWKPFEKAWDVKFHELVAYKDKHGDTNVPRNYPNRLGESVTAQRGLFAKDKISIEGKRDSIVLVLSGR